MVSSGSNKVAPESSLSESKRDDLRLSRLQFSEFHLDVDDEDDGDDAKAPEHQLSEGTLGFKKGESETIKKGACIF